MRINFCGAITGSVVMRKGETKAEAILRAEQTLLDLLERSAKNLSDDGRGPIVGLEPQDGNWGIKKES